MADLRYRAYVSYAHADETWAAWLQHALEGYRVPSRLQSAHPDRTLPRRLAPIFRDREDLSSAQDLTESLRQAMRESEAMIVVCSRAAADSRWVNEEVAYFQSLGRADRVFCMIVDGDPGILQGPESCYPPTLFDGHEDAASEPLATDPRDFADGKRLARLKLAAGLLGVRLDELRRRDLIRRRRLQAAGVLALLAALALAGNAWRSSVAERQEREKAQQMAELMVDLGEDLRNALDLDSRSRISALMLRYFEDLDPEKLPPELRIGVGKTLREVGLIAEEQARSEAALDAYTRSRDLFLAMHQELPDRVDAFFELGQAEFYIGNYHYQRGEVLDGIENIERYAKVSRELYRADPDNREWLLELSYALSGVFAVKLDSGLPLGPELLEEGEEALEVTQRAMQSLPDSTDALSNYANTLAWVADANLLACELPKALSTRQQSLDLARQAAESEPGNRDFRESVAYAYTGVASVQADLGQVEAALANLESAIDILERLWSRDPSNERVRRELFDRFQELVRLSIYQGDEQAARDGLARLEAELGRSNDSPGLRSRDLLYQIDYLITRALWYLQRDAPGGIQEVMTRLDGVLEESGWDEAEMEGRLLRMVQIRYLRWIAEGQPVLDAGGLDRLRLRYPSDAIRSCDLVLADAWLAVMEGDSAALDHAVSWLRERSFRAPEFQDLIHRHAIAVSGSG